MSRMLYGFFLPLILLATANAQHYHFPLKLSDNHRYLVDQAGSPFFYNADTGWELFLKLDDAGVREYLKDRKSRQFTVIQAMLTGVKGEKNIFGQKPFADYNNFASVNRAYFDRVEHIVQIADSMGLLLSIAPLWAGCCGEGFGGKGPVGPTSYMSTNGEKKCRELGVFIGKRFARYKNILWIMGGDMDPYGDRAEMNQLALGIRSQAPAQMMTYHPSSSHSSSDEWPDTDWLDVVMTYTYFRGFDKAWNKNQPDVYELSFQEYAKTPVKPFLLGESTYENEHAAWGSAVQARKQAYWSVLAGGTGNAYGTPMWDFPSNWRDYLNLPGGNSLRYYFSLFQSRPWYEMVPDPRSTIIQEGAGPYAHNDFAIAAADRHGRFIIAYIPSGRTFSISTAKLIGPSVRAAWYNPRDGQSTFIGDYKAQALIKLTTPGESDWVLTLDSR